MKIAEKFNSSSVVSESASGEQLRRLWQNLKARQRDALTRERQHRMATGGGGPCPDADINPNIIDIAPALLVEIQDSIDSDTQVTRVVPPVSDFITVEESTTPYTSTTGASAPDNSTIGSSSHEYTIAGAATSDLRVPLVEQSEVLAPLNQQEADDEPLFSTNEKRLRTQILKREHLRRERRAEELHDIAKKQQSEKHHLEIKILRENLREARAKANKAEQDLGTISASHDTVIS